jgi:hypothetical protein
MAFGYRHLVGAEDPLLELDTCIYLDGITYESSISSITALVFEIFGMLGSAVSQVIVGDGDGIKSKTRSPAWLLRELMRPDNSTTTTWHSLQFFPSKRNTVDETWRPPVYVGMRLNGNNNSIFLSYGNTSDWNLEREFLDRFLDHVSACASYIFTFPSAFSPLAYYWGIAVMPAQKKLRYREREEKRLSFHRDNTDIGIAEGAQRRLYSVCEGYVRDVYPAMILSQVHMTLLVSGMSFEEFVSSHGSLSAFGHGYSLLRIDPSRIDAIQKLWDESGLTLSSHRRTAT